MLTGRSVAEMKKSILSTRARRYVRQIHKRCGLYARNKVKNEQDALPIDQ